MRAGAAASYRSVGLATQVLSTQGSGLTAVLYQQAVDGLFRALTPARLRREATKVLVLIDAIDAAIADDGSDLSARLHAIHARTVALIADGCRQLAPDRIQSAIDIVAPIAEAWSTSLTRS